MNRFGCSFLLLALIVPSLVCNAAPIVLYDFTNTYVSGIRGLSIGGISYNVDFVRGSYLDVFAAASAPTFLEDYAGAANAEASIYSAFPVPERPLTGPSDQYLVPYSYDAATGFVTATFDCYQNGDHWHRHSTGSSTCPGFEMNAPVDPSNNPPVMRVSDTTVTSFAVFSVVPEPGTLALLGLLFAGIGWVRYPKRS